jgi:hypothetical protein
MKFLKVAGYYLLFLAYYIICPGVAETGLLYLGTDIGSYIAFSLSISIAVISPFFLIPLIIKRCYYGSNKRRHAVIWAWIIVVITILYLVGGFTINHGLLARDYAFCAVNISMIISLFLLKDTPPTLV